MAKRRISYRGVDFDIAYEIKYPENEHDFIVLHGWGSSKELMGGAFCSCLKKYRHIYLDLPGFGASPNEEVLTTDDYAAIIALFLDSLRSDRAIIMGHSFGGKVATLLAPQKLILLASAGIPVEKPFRIKLKIALFKLLKSFGLGSFRRYFAADDGRHLSQNMYETFKNVVDEDFRSRFGKVSAPTLLLWGKSDTATPIASAHTIAHIVDGARLVEFSGDHYFFITQKAAVCAAIEGFVK